ncbi:MAG TPA: hypothetical protein VGN16_20095 [Acidobacteriaceae bacterium]|jgi:hypothetical protein
MKIRQFLTMVPQAVQRWAAIIVNCAVLIALIMGYVIARHHDVVRTMLLCGLAGLVFGMFIAVWLLCLGFVYVDARRRAMRPALWVAVVALIPHLIGFLLYFVLRQPIAATCAQCGQMIGMYQRFCSWCGSPQSSPAPGEPPSAAANQFQSAGQ